MSNMACVNIEHAIFVIPRIRCGYERDAQDPLYDRRYYLSINRFFL